MIVLLIVHKKDIYGYELVLEVRKVLEVNEGTIYPILRRLTNEKYFETYLVESKEGPPRKYYHTTELGTRRKEELVQNWKSFNRKVNCFLEEGE